MTMFHMSNDSGSFRTALQLSEEGATRDCENWVDANAGVWVRLYEAKMINQFDHRSGSYLERGNDRGSRVLPDTHESSYANSGFVVEPYYWIPKQEVLDRLAGKGARWFLGFKDITSAISYRTVVASIIPFSGVGNSMPLLQLDSEDASRAALILANLNSLTLDYVARQKIGYIHLNFVYVRQFPILSPSHYTPADLDFVISRVLELTYTAYDLEPFASDLGYKGEPFTWNPERRALLRAELDAYYAKLYGLTRDELRYILDPADIYGDDYPSETFRVLKNNETRQFGEYRTRRLVLEAWDRLHTN